MAMIGQGQPDPYSVMPNQARFPFTKNHPNGGPFAPHEGTNRLVHSLQTKRDTQHPEKKDLVPDAEVPAAEMMFREELTGRAETAYLFH